MVRGCLGLILTGIIPIQIHKPYHLKHSSFAYFMTNYSSHHHTNAQAPPLDQVPHNLTTHRDPCVPPVVHAPIPPSPRPPRPSQMDQERAQPQVNEPHVLQPPTSRVQQPTAARTIDRRPAPTNVQRSIPMLAIPQRQFTRPQVITNAAFD